MFQKFSKFLNINIINELKLKAYYMENKAEVKYIILHYVSSQFHIWNLLVVCHCANDLNNIRYNTSKNNKHFVYIIWFVGMLVSQKMNIKLRLVHFPDKAWTVVFALEMRWLFLHPFSLLYFKLLSFLWLKGRVIF